MTLHNTERGQYSLHHEFSCSITIREEDSVRVINEYLFPRGNIFDRTLSNIGEEFEEETKEFYLECYTRGEELYEDFESTRLIERTKLLFDKILKPKVCKPNLQEDKYPNC